MIQNTQQSEQDFLDMLDGALDEAATANEAKINKPAEVDEGEDGCEGCKI